MYHKYIAYRRAQRERMIRHREHINMHVFACSTGTFTEARGKLSQGKVHCSCPLCAAKSKKYMGVRNRSVKNYKISDQRKFNKLMEQLANNDGVEA